MEFIVKDLEQMVSAKDLETLLNDKAKDGYVLWNTVVLINGTRLLVLGKSGKP